METISLSSLNHTERLETGMRILLLAILFSQSEVAPTTVAATASKSNLFFSNMYGASADSKFGLKPKDQFFY